MQLKRALWCLALCLVSAIAWQIPGLMAQDAPKAEAPKVEAAKTEAPKAEAPKGEVTIAVDKQQLDNGGKIAVSGNAPAGKQVYLEVFADEKVRSNFFDSKPDKDTGKIPYRLYLTEDMPAHYRIYLPKDKQAGIDKAKKDGKGWAYSNYLKDLGADIAYNAPAKGKIDAYQASILATIMGSRGDLLPKLDDKEQRRRAMQLTKSRFGSPGKLFAANVETSPDGSYKATVTIPESAAPGKYFVVAYADKGVKSAPATIENKIAFPTLFLENAGTSINIVGPFFLALGISIFGVLMGAGGGFMLNPLLVSIWPLPHTVVAGTVMPTVLFAQASGIVNYSKIKFINWKLGTIMGLAMLLGGFIGPKLTEYITLDQFKFVFGWVLVVLALLMFWQTTPGYLAKNKKEQELIKQCKKMAEALARGEKAEAACDLEEKKG